MTICLVSRFCLVFLLLYFMIYNLKTFCLFSKVHGRRGWLQSGRLLHRGQSHRSHLLSATDRNVTASDRRRTDLQILQKSSRQSTTAAAAAAPQPNIRPSVADA